MLLELGPVSDQDVRQWSRLARRIVIELRADPAELDGIATDELLSAWSRLIDGWSKATLPAGHLGTTGEFRCSEILDDEFAEYLLHGLASCLGSKALCDLMTDEEMTNHAGFTLHLAEALVDGLMAEDRQCEHYADQVRAALASKS
jgi:hypothetical protein